MSNEELNAGQVRALRHLSKSWCYVKNLMVDTHVSELHELLKMQFVKETARNHQEVLSITDAGRDALAAYEAQQQAKDSVRVAKGAVVLTPMNGEPPVFMRIGTIDECQQWYDYQWRQVVIQHPDLTAYPSIGRPNSIDGFHRMVQFNNQDGEPMFLLHEYREQHWWYGRCVELLQDQQQQTAHLRAHEVHDPATVDALRQSLEQDVLWQQQMVRVTSSDVIGERKDPETLVIEYEFHITELEAKVAELQRERDEFAARYIAQKTMRESAEALLQEAREAMVPIATYWHTTKHFNTGDIPLNVVCDVAAVAAKLDTALK